MTERWHGELAGLQIQAGTAAAGKEAASREASRRDGPTDSASPASYRLAFKDGRIVELNDRIGAGVQIQFNGVVGCRHCGAQSHKSFGGGYCYECFSTLARCDLCVVSPDRCHYALGTCREPDWGESFCMQPHKVYLANSSGIKVGITRSGREQGRWLDQGAIQGLAVLEADTRRAAGLAEAAIARLLPDRTDWRKMLRADVPLLDLPGIWENTLGRLAALPEGVSAVTPVAETDVVRMHYPLTATAPPAQNLRLDDGPAVGNLKGMKGQYLLLADAAFNVRAHAGYLVEVAIGEPLPESSAGEQLGLFS
mgnify:CR=1 FL=1